MNAQELCFLPATELADGLRTRRFSPVEVTDAILARIQAINPIVNAYATITADSARAEAREMEAELRRGHFRGPLHGIPVAVKDLIPTKGVRTTQGSWAHEHDVPEEDAPVVERLKAAGAILIGKTTTSEYGWKSPTESPMFGPTRNPWNLERTSAGSSGGSGVAVATGMATLALGSDGGGSIRQPASYCGVFGLKPSFGLVPNYPPGILDTFNSVGPLTRTVRDAALTLNCISGPDERDWFSLPGAHPDYLAACDGDLRGLRVAWSPDLGYAVVDPEVRRETEAAAARFSELGCEVVEANPGWADPYRLFDVLFWGYFGAVVEDMLPEWGGKLDPGLVGLAEMGRPMTSFDVARASQARIELQETARRFFQRFDLLLTPTMAMPPFPHGIAIPTEIDGKPVRGMQWTAFTYPFNLTGQPAASVPCGWTSEGLPVGLQIVGRRGEDGLVLRACAAFEMVAPWAGRRPEPEKLAGAKTS